MTKWECYHCGHIFEGENTPEECPSCHYTLTFWIETPSHGEMTVDQLAEIQPGMSAIMKLVGERYTSTYYAAKGGNWKLAAYQLNQIRAAFRTVKVTRPKFAEDLAAFDKEYLQPVVMAIHERDWRLFEATFSKGELGSDFYHDKRGVSYIRYTLPEETPSNLFRGPPEKFKRESAAKSGA